jgi:hypothetical protein
MKYGLYDVKKKQWISNGEDATGPTQYDDENLARAAAVVAGQMLRLPHGRIRAKPLPDTTFTFAGAETSEISCEEAIKELENGIN